MAVLGKDIITQQDAGQFSFSSSVLNSRQEGIPLLLTSPASIDIGKSHTSSVVILMPLHHDVKRYDAAKLAIGRLSAQSNKDDLRLVIADNGMSSDERAIMEAESLARTLKHIANWYKKLISLYKLIV